MTTTPGAQRLLEAGATASLEALVLIAAGDSPKGGIAADDGLRGPSRLCITRFDLDAAEGREAAPKPRPTPGASPDDLAVILYTSGSTGRPKGVTISHRAALAFVHWSVDTFGVRTADRVAAVAALHFDLSIFDLFATVAVGASYHPLPDFALLRPSETRQWIEDQGLTVWYSTPSTLRLLLDRGDLENRPPASLRRVLFAGEVFPTPALRRLRAALPDAELYNLYGPTESNVCTYHRVDTVPDDDQVNIPLGRACAGTRVEVLDGEGQPTDDHQVGELWVHGPTLMAGYWGSPETTARVLVSPPGRPSDDGPWLRTGDLAHRDGDGLLHFHGRRDHMVKVRGYRVELGEVEAALASHPGLETVAVVPIPDDVGSGVRLRAWLVPRQAPVTALTLKVFLGERLPPYMIPTEFRSLDDLPRTSTGKIDRQNLATRTD